MNMTIGGLIAIVFVAAAIGWLFCLLLNRARHVGAIGRLQKEAAGDLAQSQKELELVRATAGEQLQGLRRDVDRLQDEKIAVSNGLTMRMGEIAELQRSLATATANATAANEATTGKVEELKVVREELAGARQELMRSGQSLAQALADNRALEGRLKTQVEEVDQLQKRFATEFENMANRILDNKTQKFTDLNKTNLEAVLGPLGKQIIEFREQVSKVYQDESKERFSLGERVKELKELNVMLG